MYGLLIDITYLYKLSPYPLYQVPTVKYKGTLCVIYSDPGKLAIITWRPDCPFPRVTLCPFPGALPFLITLNDILHVKLLLHQGRSVMKHSVRLFYL